MDINSGQILVWDSLPGASSYDLELLSESAGTSYGVFTSVDAEIAATEFLVDRQFGNYLVRVRPAEFAGPGAWSQLVNLTFVSLPAVTNIHVV